MKSFLVTALEASANLHLKEVLKAYKAEFGGFELFGIFDENLMKEALNLSENSQNTSNSNQNLNLNENSQTSLNLNVLNSSEVILNSKQASQNFLNSNQNLNLNESVNSLNSKENSQNSLNLNVLNSSEATLNSSQNLQNSINSNQNLNLNDLNSNESSNTKPQNDTVIIHAPLYSSHEFCAMGFVEVLPLIFKAKRAIKELTHLALQRQNSSLNPQNDNFAPSHIDFQVAHSEGKISANSSQIQKPSKPFDAILCIDSPAFNIPLAKALNSAGIKAKKIYYILPQVWAWKRGRVPIIEANFNELASILPFDKHFFSKSTFVGHPLLDELKEFKNEADIEALLNKEEDEKVVSFLPGSRKGEIKRLMPVFRELALNFKGEKILCVPPFNIDKLDALYGDTKGFKVVTNTPQALKKSDFAFICSGTATLEAALIGTPFVLAYKARAIDVLIARFFVKLKHIGLANIMCDFEGKSELNPEFLQNEVSAKNLFEAYRNFDFKEFFDKVTFLKKYLRFGAAKNVAKMLKG